MNGIDFSFWIGMAAAVALLPYLRRLSMLNWRSHLWHVVAMHLAWALWLLWIAYDGLTGQSIDPYNGLGVLGAFLTWETSRVRWRDGPPAYTRSGPMPLDEGELVSTHGKHR